MFAKNTRFLGVVVVIAALVVSCSTKPETCLSGPAGCERADVCEKLESSCTAPSFFVGQLSDLPGGLDLEGAEGTAGDWVLQNDTITVIVDALDEPHSLAPTGGNILDMGARGGGDDINLIYQLAGVLPEDTLAYKSIEVIDKSPEMVALVVRGTLDGRDEVEVVTRYELHGCESGVRMRTELYNGSPDIQPLVIADGWHWGKRNALPFAPLPGQGFVQPSFELVKLADEYAGYDFVMGRAAEDDAPSYGIVSCDRKQVRGVNSTELSALGTGIELVRPGQERSYQRFISVTQSPDLNDATELVATMRTKLHGDPAPVKVSGDLVSEGFPFSGSVRRGVVVLSEIVGNDLRRPLTTALPNEQGHFEATVPSQSWLWYDVWSFGRVVDSGVVPRTQNADLGTLEIEAPARLVVSSVGDAVPMLSTLVVQPADEATRQRVEGTWMGEFTACAPWLGPPVAGSPACNFVHVPEQGVDFEIPAGRYELWFTAGPEWTLVRVDVELVAGEVHNVAAALASLDVAPAGWLSTDLHVHGGGSFDSSLPDVDRVLSFVAQGVDVIASTDHDYVTDYAKTVDDLGVGDRVVVMGGLETTPLIPHMSVPDSEFPKVIGHFNHWPMKVDPMAPRGGAPWDELAEPGALFERVAPFMGEEGIHMLNHPWEPTQFGRDLGFLKAIGFDPREPIPDEDDGTANGMLLRETEAGLRNIDFHLYELQNAAHALNVIRSRGLWFALLTAGHVRTAVANSDSHTIDEPLGFGRSYVEADMSLDNFDPVGFNRALKAGKVVGGNGVVVLATIGPDGGPRRGLGFEPYVPAAGDTLEIEVRAPPWIPVQEVRIITSKGELVLASGAQLSHPENPLGVDGILRYQASIALDSVMDMGSDDWLVVEAGFAFFDFADLDDDGVPDTTDNNGDGVINEEDIEEDEDSGPLESPADPTNKSDPRYAMTRVLKHGWPYGFTNPFLIDWAGDGWQAPRIGGGQ